jgi:hypothetical protein
MRQHAPEDRKGRGGLLVQLLKGCTRQPLQILGEMKGRVVGHLGGLWMTRLLSAREKMYAVLIIASYAKAQPAALAWTFKGSKAVEREVWSCYVEDASAHHRIIGCLR